MWKSRVQTVLVALAFGFLTVVQLNAQFGPGAGYAYIPQDAYSVIAEVQAKPGMTEQLRAATLPLMTLVRNDPKNLVYFLQEDRERPGHFIFFEVFATKEDFDAHNDQPYVKAWFAKLPQLAVGGVKTTRMAVQTRAQE